VVLFVDWVISPVLKQGLGADRWVTKVIQVRPMRIRSRLGMDYQGLPPVDVYMMCEPIPVVSLLLGAVKVAAAASRPSPGASERLADIGDDPHRFADALKRASKGLDVCMTRLPASCGTAAIAISISPLD